MQVAGVEGAVPVHHGEEVVGRGQHAGVHRGAVPGALLADHRRAERACHVRRVVGGAVVDDDDREVVGHVGQHLAQRRSLVAAREHEVADGEHDATVGARTRAERARTLTKGLRISGVQEDDRPLP